MSVKNSDEPFMIEVRKVVIVKNYAISGSLFMMSLLDGHPQIITLPMGLDMSVVNLWNRISSERNFKHENIFSRIKKDIPAFFDANHAEESCREMGESGNQRIEINKDEFFLHLGKLLDEAGNITRKKFITAIFLAYNLCNGREFSDDSIICLSAHEASLNYVQWVLEDFEEVYVMHMMREHVQNLGSLMKALNFYRSNFYIFNGMLEAGIRSIILDQSIVPKHGTRIGQYSGVIVHGKFPYFEDNNIVSSRAVRLEDVHLRSQETMQKICNWLKITWNDSLMTSTFDGKKWYNRSGYMRVSGFSDKIVSQKYEKYFNSFDRYRLKLLTKNEQVWFNYKEIGFCDLLVFYAIFPLLCLIPFKVEFDCDRFSYRFQILAKLKVKNDAKMIAREWIATNYNKRNFRDEINQKLERIYNKKKLRYFNQWIDDNHRSNNFTNNFYDLLTKNIDQKLYSKAAKWIVDNQYEDLDLFSNLKSKDSNLIIFLKYCPAIIKRLLINYRDSRVLIFKLWKERLFKDDSSSYVKLL